MSRKDRKHPGFARGAAGKAAPGARHEGEDMKVPIDTDDSVADAEYEPAGNPASPDPVDEEAAKVEAAIKAGEQAADQDLKDDVNRLREERDYLEMKLAKKGQELEAAKAEATGAADRVTRLQADWDNYRRRTSQERVAERERATEKLVTSLLPIIDDMERAIEHSSKAAEGDENLRQFVDGMSAVHSKLLDTLGREGVEVISPAGEAFEPLLHQAVGRVEDHDAYADTVADVYQPGYRMGGKVIRPAMVTVTFGGEARPPEAQEGRPSDGTDPDPSKGRGDAKE